MKFKIILLFFVLGSLSLASQKKEYRIGILLDNRTEDLTPLIEQMKTEIQAVVGEDARISFSDSNIMVNNYSLEQAETNYRQLVEGDVDIILAFGAINSEILGVQKSFAKPTILFGAVNSDFSKIDLKKASSGIENFTYLIELHSYLDDFKKFKELTGFKNLGIAIEEQLTGIFPLKETFEQALDPLDAGYKIIPFRNGSDIAQNLNGIDAIYLAGGFFLKKEEVKGLAAAFIEKKIPSFTINSVDDVVLGIMATRQSSDNITQIFRRIALTVEAYINGASLATLDTSIDFSSRLTLNFNTALLVDIPLKYSLIAETDFVGTFNNVLSERPYNLLDVINLALENNFSLKSTEKDVALSQQDVKTAKSNYLPSLTASGTATYIDPDLAEISNGQNPEFSTDGNITLQQTLFSEAANANISINKNLKKASEANLSASQLDLVFEAANAYFNVLILKANLQIQSQNLNLTKKNLQIADQNFEAGQGGKVDLLRFRSQMAQNTQDLVEAINQFEQGFVNLNFVLSNPTNLEIDVEDVALNQGVLEKYDYDQLVMLLDESAIREHFINFLIKEAKKNAPELKSIDHNLQATERSLRLNSYGRFLPTVALQGQYNQNFNRSGVGSTSAPGFVLIDNNYNVGLNVSLPLINQNRNNIDRQTAIIQKEQLTLNQENITLSIEANVRNGVLNLVNQVSNIELSTISEETAKESLELTQTAYSNGAVNIVQLLDAQSNYLNSQLAKANAVYNFLINTLQLERFLGYYFLLNTEEDNETFRRRFFEYLNSQN